MELLQQLIVLLGSLAGFAALVAFVINALKSFGIIKDGMAPTVSAGINLAGLVALYLLGIFVPDFDVAGLDQKLAEFASVAVPFFAYVIQLVSSRVAHSAARGTWLIGKSYSQ